MKSKLVELAKKRDLLQQQIETLESYAEAILRVLFDEQHTMFIEVEKEFSEILSGSNYQFNPRHKFCGIGHYFDYDFTHERASQDWFWNDGDFSTTVHLLKEFFNGASQEEKREAIRKVFRDAIEEKRKRDTGNAQKEIENAKRILRDAGML